MHMRSWIATVALLAGSVGLVGQNQPAAPAAAISGTVRHGTTGRPIDGAVVSLRGGLNAPLARVQRQLTDPQGRFVFRDLPAGRGYSLTASRPGLVEGSYGQGVMLGPSGSVTLSDGQWFNRADILLWKPGAISGRVTDEHGDPLVGIFVRVLAQHVVAGQARLLGGSAARTDDRGEYRIAGLLPGRYLVVVPSAQGTVPPDRPIDVSSSEKARAEMLERQAIGISLPTPQTSAALDLDPAGRLVVGNFPTPPLSEGGRAQTYPITFHPGAPGPQGATPIELGLAEERRGVDIGLRPVAAVQVRGTVDGPADKVAGLFLRLMPAGLEALAAASAAATTFVGADGRFVFLNVPAGAYTIDARRTTTELILSAGIEGPTLPSAAGTTETSGSIGSLPTGPPGTGYRSFDGPTSTAFWTRTPVVVGSADVEIAVPLQPTVTIRGRMVFEGTTRITATAPMGGGMATGVAPAAAVAVDVPATRPERIPIVYAEPASGDAALGIRQGGGTATSDTGDTFSIGGLLTGEYVLRVPSGGGRYMVKSIHAGGRDITDRPLSVGPGGAFEEVVITFTDKVAVLTGTIRGEASLLSRAAVLIFPVDRTQWTDYGFRPTRLAGTPASDARYRVDGLPAGEYFVMAVDVAQITAWQDPAFLAKAAGTATRVRIEWGETRVVDLSLTRAQ